MKHQMLKLFSLLAVVAFLFSCKSQVIISRGTSFGHCRGYCNKEIVVSKTSIVFIQRQNGELPETKIRTAKSNQSATLTGLMEGFDENAFNAMEKVIGCPDCADGGAEWIELRKGQKVTRVTFEFGKAPENLVSIAEKLKKIQQQFDK